MNNKEAAQIIRTAVLKEEGKSEYSDQDIKIALEIAAELLDSHPEHKIISREEYKKLARVGILNTSVRAYNRGNSDYSQHVIQPWSIWIDSALGRILSTANLSLFSQSDPQMSTFSSLPSFPSIVM